MDESQTEIYMGSTPVTYPVNVTNPTSHSVDN
jgi:hypothetical protein